MEKRFTNKRLVKKLMDTKGIDMISITSTLVIVQVAKSFTPEKAKELCRELGQENFKAATKNGDNYIVFKRF